MTDFVAFDLETTGLSPKADRIIEIGAVRFSLESDETRELRVFADPEMPIPLAIQRLTGITDDDVAGAPAPAEAVSRLGEFCEGATLIAHGAVFDMAFCAGLAPGAFNGRTVHDTLELARILLPLEPGHGLPQLARRFGLAHERPHRAWSDATATAELFQTLVAETQSLRAPTLAEMRRVASQDGGSLAAFFAAAASAPPRKRRLPLSGGTEAPPKRAEPAAGALDDAVARLLEGGALVERPGYEHRPAQVEMARAVAQTLERGGRLLVEAGTGVGKSLGYLAPLGLWLDGSRRAVVATHTIALQEQLAGRELAALQPLLPREVRAATLKGRRHYISLRRWQRYLRTGDARQHGADADAVRFKLKVLRWLELTRTGDRGELRLTSGERERWRHVESQVDDCLGAACANWADGGCFMVQARRRAAAAELVVTNHAMLLSGGDEGELLGDFDALVVDEAHHLEDAAIRAGGHRLSGYDADAVLERLEEVDDAEVRAAAEACAELASGLFGDAKGLLGELLGGPVNGTALLDGELREDPRLRPLLRHAERLTSRLRDLAADLRQRADALGLTALPQPERSPEEVQLVAGALEGLAGAVADVLLAPRPGHLAWLEMRAEEASLHDAPTGAADDLGEGVLDRARATVLTSATLAVGGDFTFIRERLGLGRRTEELAVSSPFDYLSQSICIVAGDAPAYDDPGYEPLLARMVAEIAERLGGRTLALFTGYGPLRRVHDILDRKLGPAGIVVLGQGLDGTRRQILQSFIESPRTVLLGTASFWEGIDVPGDALQCVVIAKLPFAVPTDPQVRARTEGLEDPFGRWVLPEAVIRLRQGFGRLIRSSRDRGAVVIADPRVLDRVYGRRFLEALPPATVVREPAAAVAGRVAEFLAASAIAGGGGESGHDHAV